MQGTCLSSSIQWGNSIDNQFSRIVIQSFCDFSLQKLEFWVFCIVSKWWACERWNPLQNGTGWWSRFHRSIQDGWSHNLFCFWSRRFRSLQCLLPKGSLKFHAPLSLSWGGGVNVWQILHKDTLYPSLRQKKIRSHAHLSVSSWNNNSSMPSMP